MRRLAVGGALIALTGSGVVVVVGAPTVILSAAGAALAIGGLLAAVDALDHLRECLAGQGNEAAAANLARTVEALQAQVADLQARLGPRPD